MRLGSFSLATNLCKGYSLEDALYIVKKCGFDNVEISSIVNMCEHVTPQEMNAEYAAKVKEMMNNSALSCYAFSGHVDLTEDGQYQDFLKKIEFAAQIGAKIINTNSGPIDKKDIFFKNMVKIIEVAEKWGIIIGLESHGDIVSTAKDSVSIFEHFNHPLVRLNYDTGNTLFYSRGTVRVEEDIKYGLPYLAHLHLKDITIRNGKVEYCAIGKGDIAFPQFFEALKDCKQEIPCGFEIPVHVKGDLDLLKPVGTPMSETDIFAAAKTSLDYVTQQLEKTS